MYVCAHNKSKTLCLLVACGAFCDDDDDDDDGWEEGTAAVRQNAHNNYNNNTTSLSLFIFCDIFSINLTINSLF